jgi:hypothetical protein
LEPRLNGSKAGVTLHLKESARACHHSLPDAGLACSSGAPCSNHTCPKLRVVGHDTDSNKKKSISVDVVHLAGFMSANGTFFSPNKAKKNKLNKKFNVEF